ncbi:MAG: cytochrome bc1 complex Rieske iron-sulfur subunit [Carbonactinosporaceae bacterium]
MSEHDKPARMPGHEAPDVPARTGADEGRPSGEVAPADPFADPGLPAHVPRRADVDERAARRAERQVALLFTISALSSVAFMVGYALIDVHTVAYIPPIGKTSVSNVVLGVSMGLAFFCIGAGAIHWARKLMTDKEIVEERHPLASSEADRKAALATFDQGVDDSGFGRRKLIRRSLLGALGALALPPLFLLRDLGPLPKKKLRRTAWADEQIIINESTGRRVRPEDLEVGTIIHAQPKHVHDLDVLAKAAVLLVRLEPGDIKDSREAREGYQGIVCFSKICTHVGCPVSLYERRTHTLLCPCHQSTFDVADGGRVVFGPAARSLPQLAITVDAEGYLVAKGDFDQPVGPSFWERGET